MTVICSGFESRRLHRFGGPNGLDYHLTQPGALVGSSPARDGTQPDTRPPTYSHRPQWCGPKPATKKGMNERSLAMTYLSKWFNLKKTPQSQPIPGTAQVRNDNAGYVWAVDDWARLDRFLILGSEGGSYYASERALTRESAEAVLRCIAADGARVVERI